MSEQIIYESNAGIIGKSFASWHGMGAATYIDTKSVPERFRRLCESTPHHAWDHIVYGMRADGQYIGVGQPYPMSANTIHTVNKYCQSVGLDMMVTGGSTWYMECIRIVFQRDAENIERFNIAMECPRWNEDYPSEGDRNHLIDCVNRKLNEQKVI